MEQMKKHTTVPLSPIVAGTMKWGVWGENHKAATIAEMITHLTAEGITSFDLAPIYGDYTTEKLFGQAFAQTNINRESVQFVSKCGIQYPGPNSPYKIKHYDYSAKEITRSIDQSLRDLRTEYLDVLLFHRPSPLMFADEILAALETAANLGKIKSFGVSNFDIPKMEWLSSLIPIAYNQIEFSLNSHQAMSNGLLDYMQLKNIKPMAYKPLGNVFSGSSNRDLILREALERMSIKYDTAIDVLLLAWIMKHPTGIIPVVVSAKSQRIIHQMSAKRVAFETEDWFELYTLSMGNKVP
jgi:predicted oxidoreductase